METNNTSTTSKIKKISYWTVTAIISIVLINGGINDALQRMPYMGFLRSMGYPDYFAIIIGIWKVLGVVAILIPGFKLIKEWAYAGFFFLLSGAIVSHAVIGDNPVFQILMLLFICLSWYLRPASRKFIPAAIKNN